jgi:hypothetical protein
MQDVELELDAYRAKSLESFLHPLENLVLEPLSVDFDEIDC